MILPMSIILLMLIKNDISIMAKPTKKHLTPTKTRLHSDCKQRNNRSVRKQKFSYTLRELKICYFDQVVSRPVRK